MVTFDMLTVNLQARGNLVQFIGSKDSASFFHCLQENCFPEIRLCLLCLEVVKKLQSNLLNRPTCGQKIAGPTRQVGQLGELLILTMGYGPCGIIYGILHPQSLMAVSNHCAAMMMMRKRTLLVLSIYSSTPGTLKPSPEDNVHLGNFALHHKALSIQGGSGLHCLLVLILLLQYPCYCSLANVELFG